MNTVQAPTTSSSRSPDSAGGDFVRVLIAILFPPLGVALETGLSKTLLLNIFLTLLGYIPGIIHAVYTIYKR